MYKKGAGNDKQRKDAGNRTLCPYRNFSQAISFSYCAIFLPLRFYGTECPHTNDTGLNLPGKTQVIKIDRTSILNNDSWLLVAFWDRMCEVH